MSYEDKLLYCPDCDKPFLFSANAQALSDELDQGIPARCNVCWQILDSGRRNTEKEYRPNPFSLPSLSTASLISGNLN